MESTKTLVIFGMLVGSFAGGYLPVLWGDSGFSMTAVFTSSIGGLIGIWAGYQLAQRID